MTQKPGRLSAIGEAALDEMVRATTPASGYPTSPEVKRRQTIERRIAGRAIIDILLAGCTISVNDGEETTLIRSNDPEAILRAMFTTDEDLLYVHRSDGTRIATFSTERDCLGFVQFIYGNDGHDVISDYTDGGVVAKLLEGANALADLIEQGRA